MYEDNKYIGQIVKHKEVDGIKINIIYDMEAFYSMLDELAKELEMI